MGRTFVWIAAVGLLAASSCQRTRVERCEQLREHLIDLRIAGAPDGDRAAHREAMRQALGDGFITSCTTTLSEAQVACAMKAGSSEAAVACNPSTHN